MKRSQQVDLIAPSLLDRLTNRLPGFVPKPGGGMSIKDLKQSVRLDLENLLNARVRIRSSPASLEQLRDSLINYGTPDLSGVALNSYDDRERFRQLIENTIRSFEPRLTNVRLVMLPQAEPEDRVMRFRIEAELKVEPVPEPVVFDSLVEPGMRRIHVHKAM